MIFHSHFENSYLWLPLIGFIIGFFGTIIGGGGGFFFIPVLTMLFGVPAQIAVATSLAATLPVCIVGSFGHHRKGNADIRIAVAFAIAGIAGALSGASITRLLTTDQLKISFGSYSILIALLMLLNQRKEKIDDENGKETSNSSLWEKITKGSVFGFLAGVITGTFGTTGTAPVQAGLFALRMPIKIVVGTSLMVSAVNTLSALGAHFLVGQIDLSLVYFLTSGAVAGAIIGPRVLANVDFGTTEGPIRWWYAVGMIAFGIMMIVT
ncbi:MAG: sulfite exporter TauE/SafE family protein [Bacteroidales bacterium]|jgi:uncharacterized membrane protein YfcA|nr:sulfite exporter TauE/SafE family protein [Bacteroidales bacterium]